MIHPSRSPAPFDNFRNLSSADLIQIILKQRDHYGEALVKVARLARKMADNPRSVDFHNLADIAIQLRETYGIGEARLDEALRGGRPPRRRT